MTNRPNKLVLPIESNNGGVLTTEKEDESITSSESGPVKVFYDEQQGRWVWFIVDHKLTLPKVGPFALTKEVGVRRYLVAEAFGVPSYPFVNQDVADAVAAFLNSVGVAKLGFCEKAICITTSEKFRAGNVGMTDLIREIAILLNKGLINRMLEFLPNEDLDACDTCDKCGIGYDPD